MSVKFLVFTDLHYDEMSDGAKRLEELTRAVEKNNPEFCISLGDFCEPIDDNILLKRIIEGTKVPIYYVIGNHETDHHSIDEVQAFMGLEKPYYSFEIREHKFIVLNTCYWNKDGIDYSYFERNYKEKGAAFPVVAQDELKWLETELQDNKKHIIFSHHSFINGFANRGVSNRQRVREMLKNKNVLLCMNGHDHGDAMVMEDNTVFYTVNSASYMWAGSQIASSKEFTRKYGYLHGILPYKQAFYVMVEIDESTIRIQGMDGEYLSVTPDDIGLSDYKWNGVSVLPKASSFKIKYMPQGIGRRLAMREGYGLEDHKTKIVVLDSKCPLYQKGDEIYFDGAFINKEKSKDLCMVALNAVYPFVYAARRGGSVKETPVQCPDCGESVTFQVERID